MKASIEESVGETRGQHRPLVVDLDTSLVKTDLLIEAILILLKRQPLYLLVFPLWIVRGKAWFRQQVARRVSLDPATLPWRSELIDDLRRQHAEGRPLVLVTGSDVRFAQA